MTVKIDLFIGDGWAPFNLEPGESVAWDLPDAHELDVAATLDKLATEFEAKVREVYPDAEIAVRPQAEGDGHLVRVDLSGTSDERVDEALALTSEDLADDGFDPAAMIEGEIAGLLDGIVRDRPNTWRVPA